MTNYSTVSPTTIAALVCPECGVEACVEQIRYSYPRPNYRRDRRGHLHQNHLPSSNIYYHCHYCKLDEPEEYFADREVYY